MRPPRGGQHHKFKEANSCIEEERDFIEFWSFLFKWDSDARTSLP